MSRCKYGFTAESCELGYPGCGCADDAMAEIDRMASVSHAYVEGWVPGVQENDEDGYPICAVCFGSADMPIHTPAQQPEGETRE